MTPLIKSVVLACAPDRAFELFTQHATEWWPPERRHTGDPASTIAIQADGPVFEQAGDGRRVELGRVRVWAPPDRLELDWYPGTDADHPTSVIVTFVPEGAGTRITIEHAPTPSSEPLWGTRVPRYATSWDLVIAAIVRHAVEIG